jgi:hypothetical protein
VRPKWGTGSSDGKDQVGSIGDLKYFPSIAHNVEVYIQNCGILSSDTFEALDGKTHPVVDESTTSNPGISGTFFEQASLDAHLNGQAAAMVVVKRELFGNFEEVWTNKMTNVPCLSMTTENAETSTRTRAEMIHAKTAKQLKKMTKAQIQEQSDALFAAAVDVTHPFYHMVPDQMKKIAKDVTLQDPYRPTSYTSSKGLWADTTARLKTTRTMSWVQKVLERFYSTTGVFVRQQKVAQVRTVLNNNNRGAIEQRRLARERIRNRVAHLKFSCKQKDTVILAKSDRQIMDELHWHWMRQPKHFRVLSKKEAGRGRKGHHTLRVRDRVKVDFTWGHCGRRKYGNNELISNNDLFDLQSACGSIDKLNRRARQSRTRSHKMGQRRAATADLKEGKKMVDERTARQNRRMKQINEDIASGGNAPRWYGGATQLNHALPTVTNAAFDQAKNKRMSHTDKI